MPAKRTSKRTRKCGVPPTKSPGLTDNFLQDFVSHKSSVFVIMAAALSLGALFSLMLGVSAASIH
ncbi:MAG: hypothetical protein WCW31_00685 [Patescibacteria group bacterium]